MPPRLGHKVIWLCAPPSPWPIVVRTDKIEIEGRLHPVQKETSKGKFVLSTIVSSTCAWLLSEMHTVD